MWGVARFVTEGEKEFTVCKFVSVKSRCRRYATEGPALSVQGVLRVRCSRGGTLPLQVVDFALVGPVLWLFGVAVPYGVVADVIPFLTVTLPTSKLAIPEMPLP